MFEEYDDRVRNVMQIANKEAHRFNNSMIDSEHILLGLVKEGSGVAAKVLKRLDVDLIKIRREVERHIQSGPDDVGFGRLPYSRLGEKIVQLAKIEANATSNWRGQMKSGQGKIGTEHILFALFRAAEGLAYEVLRTIGLTYDDVFQETKDLLGITLDATATPKSISFLLDPGSASASEIGELYFEISRLYRMIGGAGITFTVTDCRLPQTSEGLS